jgi:hypothetical protein
MYAEKSAKHLDQKCAKIQKFQPQRTSTNAIASMEINLDGSLETEK